MQVAARSPDADELALRSRRLVQISSLTMAGLAIVALLLGAAGVAVGFDGDTG